MTMLHKTTIFCALLSASFMVSVAAAAEDMNCPKQPDDPLVKLLSPPPCGSCAQTKIEVDELRTLERNRSEAQVKHAVADYKISVERFLQGADIKFDAAAIANCQPIFDRLMQRTKSAAEHAKNTFCRMRPFNLPDNDLRPLDASKMSPSYPSGHTTAGAALGAVLAHMVPEKSASLYARADDFGHSRMIAGVHYRSDVEAGKLLGIAVAQEAFANDPKFATMLPAATRCVRGALGLAAEPDVAAQAAETSGAKGTTLAKP